MIIFTEDGVPTSVDFVRCDPGQMVASYTSANTYLFDLETNKQVLTLETKQNNGMLFKHMSIEMLISIDSIDIYIIGKIKVFSSYFILSINVFQESSW